MSGFEPWNSGIGNDHNANCVAKTFAPLSILLISLDICLHYIQKKKLSQEMVLCS